MHIIFSMYNFILAVVEAIFVHGITLASKNVMYLYYTYTIARHT